MLHFLTEILGDWALWPVNRLPPRAIRLLAAVFVVLCTAATVAFLVVLILLFPLEGN